MCEKSGVNRQSLASFNVMFWTPMQVLRSARRYSRNARSVLLSFLRRWFCWGKTLFEVVVWWVVPELSELTVVADHAA